MPEGDTIHKTARTLRAVLDGRTLVRFEAPRLTGRLPQPGETVTGVEARGKHLLIHFSGGLALHTHMLMTGSWHVYRPGERWWRAPSRARAVVEVEGAVAVCWAAPVVEIRDGRSTSRYQRHLERLGPDLTAPSPGLDEALSRMATLPPATEIGVALLNQRVAAGIGNVFKSEVLWACRVSPFARVGDLDEATRRALLTTASAQLRANLGGGPRTTVPGGLAVYGRAGKPCRRCRTPVRVARQGEDARSTFWCPACQAGTAGAEGEARDAGGR